MFEIKCDSASDLTAFFQETVEAKVQARTINEKLWQAEEKNRELKDEVWRLKEELRLSKLSPPKPEYERLLKDLISNARSENKIGCIKIIREITGRGLKEAKDTFEAGWNETPNKPGFGQVG